MIIRTFGRAMEDIRTTDDIQQGELQALTRAERRDLQTQRILEAAKCCFVRSGFQGASMQQICGEAGMSPGALYRYFPSKEAIVEAICEADRSEDAEIFTMVLGNPSPVDGIVETALAHIKHMHKRGLAPLFAEIRAEAMRNESVRQTSDESRGQVAMMIRNYLEASIARGEIDPPVDLDTLLVTIMAMGEGIAMNDLPGMGFSPERLEPLLRAMVEGMLRPKKTAAAQGA